MRILVLLLLVVIPVEAQGLSELVHSTEAGSARVGLALSGGAALGFAHIGVLKVLEREGIPVCGISGNSMGALVGGIFAAGYRAAEIESIVLQADWEWVFSSAVPFGARYLPERQQAERYVLQLRHRNLLPSLPSGLVPLQNVEFLMMGLLSDIEHNTGYDFDSLVIPYRAVAVDLVTGRKQVLKRGRLAQAIRASIAIPGVFAPELLDGMELVDGGIQQYLPVDPLRDFEPDLIIAVLTMRHSPETGISLIDIASRSMDLIGVEDLARQKEMADVLIEPDVEPFKHSDFARARGLIAAGEAAAEAALPEIRAKLAGRRPVEYRHEVSVRSLAMVRSLRFEGLGVTRESMLRPLMRSRPGAYLLFDRLRQDLERVFHTGLFEDVNYRLEFGRAESVDVIVELKERAYGFYLLGIRYDNVDDVGLGIEVGQGNLGGSGASVRGAIQLGNPTEFRLGLTGTRLFTLPFGYRLDGFWASTDHSYSVDGRWSTDYNTDRRGGVAEAGYILGRNAFFDVGVRVYEALHRFPRLSILDTLPRKEWLAGPVFRLEFNDFNDLQIPTAGLRYGVEAFYAEFRQFDSSGVSLREGNFLRAEVSLERVLPIGSRLLLRPGWQFGLSLGEPCWVARFHSGGEELPGFANEEFTSTSKAAFVLELDFRLLDLFHQENYPLYLRFFSALATFQKFDRIPGEADLRSAFDWSVGTGILTNTPIGPFKLEVGIVDFGKPLPDAGRRFNFRLSVGRDFRYSH